MEEGKRGGLLRFPLRTFRGIRVTDLLVFRISWHGASLLKSWIWLTLFVCLVGPLRIISLHSTNSCAGIDTLICTILKGHCHAMTCAVFLTPIDSTDFLFRLTRLPKNNKMHIDVLSMISSPRNKSKRKYHAVNSVKCGREHCRLYKRSHNFFFLWYTKHIIKVNMPFQSWKRVHLFLRDDFEVERW